MQIHIREHIMRVLAHKGRFIFLDNPMTFLRVTSAQNRKAELTPLDSSIDLAQLDGIEVTFLEFNQ